MLKQIVALALLDSPITRTFANVSIETLSITLLFILPAAQWYMLTQIVAPQTVRLHHLRAIIPFFVPSYVNVAL